MRRNYPKSPHPTHPPTHSPTPKTGVGITSSPKSCPGRALRTNAPSRSPVGNRHTSAEAAARKGSACQTHRV